MLNFTQPQSAVFFVYTWIGGALSVILVSHAQTTSIFGDQTISKCP